jgi:hypothetical protein
MSVDLQGLSFGLDSKSACVFCATNAEIIGSLAHDDNVGAKYKKDVARATSLYYAMRAR